jgi:hypothetical protein
VGKHQGALRHGVEIAREGQPREVVEEAPFEQWRAVGSALLREVREVAVVEATRAQIVDRVREPARHRKATREGSTAKAEAEDGFPLGEPMLVSRVGHRELVEVGAEGERGSIELGGEAWARPCHPPL